MRITAAQGRYRTRTIRYSRKAEIRKIVGYTILILAVIAIVGLIWAFLDVLFLIFIFILLGLPAIILVNLFRR